MRIAVLVPCYGRPEYTELCIKALKASPDYASADFFYKDGANGLRNTIIDFFDEVRDKYDYIAKMDNDCVVPKNWLDDLVYALETERYDIVSPNVEPSNAAFSVGKDSDGLVRPADHVGGLWCMKVSLIRDMSFERFSPNGITGAFNIIKQIVAENDAKVGWVPGVTVQDIGHWSGLHPLHIKSKEHEEYSVSIGRNISWSSTK